MNDTIVVIAQHSQGAADPVTYEAIACAMELCGGDNSCIRVIVPGKQTADIAEKIAGTTGADVTAVEGKGLKLYNAEAYIKVLEGFLKDIKPLYIVLPHTSTGYDLAPALAVKLKASCITAVEKINHADGKHTFIRPLFNGRLYAEVVPETESTVITVQPGAWHKAVGSPDKKGRVNVITADAGSTKTRTISIKHSEYESAALSQSDVIISAGRGIGKKENLSLIRELAGIFKRSAIGCSRAVCDVGWLGYRHQVGTTGVTVSPKLYLACGISGAIQHVSGIKGAQTIIAVNTDPHARIFSVADYCVVEDLEQFIPAVLEAYGRLYSE